MISQSKFSLSCFAYLFSFLASWPYLEIELTLLITCFAQLLIQSFSRASLKNNMIRRPVVCSGGCAYLRSICFGTIFNPVYLGTIHSFKKETMQQFLYIILFSILMAGCNDNSATSTTESRTAGTKKQEKDRSSKSGDASFDTTGGV